MSPGRIVYILYKYRIVASSMHGEMRHNDQRNAQRLSNAKKGINAPRTSVSQWCIEYKMYIHIVLATPAKQTHIYTVDLNCSSMLSEHPYICWQRISDFLLLSVYFRCHCFVLSLTLSLPLSLSRHWLGFGFACETIQFHYSARR